VLGTQAKNILLLSDGYKRLHICRDCFRNGLLILCFCGHRCMPDSVGVLYGKTALLSAVASGWVEK